MWYNASDSLVDQINLTLAPATGATEIHMEMNSSVAGELDLAELNVAAATGLSLQINSAGSASLPGNVIDNVSNVDVNVAIIGGTHLTFGSAADPFTFLDPAGTQGGLIDASGDAGGVETWLDAFPTGTGLPAQTYIGGTGSDLVHLFGFGGDVVDLTANPSSAVEFTQANFFGAPLDPINDASFHQFNQVLGATAATGINIHNNAGLTLPGRSGTPTAVPR